MSTTLYIVKMQNNIYFWGQPLSMIWGATVPLQMKIIFNFFNDYFKGERVSALFAV